MTALALAFVAGVVAGGVVVVHGTWYAFRDNARRYFALRGYGPEAATREADRVLGLTLYDPRGDKGDRDS